MKKLSFWNLSPNDPPVNSTRQFISRIIVALLLVSLFLQAVLSMRLLSASNDEIAHLASGYTYIVTGSFRLNPQHPPLIKLLCAAPLLFLKPRLNLADPAWGRSDEWRFGFNFLYSNDADRLLFWGRLPVVLLSVVLGSFVYRWAGDLFGASAGLMALFLYAFCPNIIAHSRFVTMDLGLSCFFVISLYYLWRYSRAGGTLNLIAAGVGLGLALSTKFSAVILVPAFLLLLLLAAWRPPARQLVQMKRAHGCRHASLNLIEPFGTDDLRSRLRLAGAAFAVTVGIGFLVVYLVYFFPRDTLFYWNSMAQVDKDHDSNYVHYLLGHFKHGNWWYYFVVAYLIKTPAVVLVLLILSVARPKIVPFSERLDRAFIVLPGFLFLVFTSAFADNIGVRYILPLYPLTFVYVLRGHLKSGQTSTAQNRPKGRCVRQSVFTVIRPPCASPRDSSCASCAGRT